MPKHKKPSVKLRRIKIKNFKAIDSLELEFPAPRMEGEPDVFVMGSKNGIGKTSVLESCALLLLGTIWGEEPFFIHRYFEEAINIHDLLVRLVRSGKNEAAIEGEFEISGKVVPSKIEINRSAEVRISRKDLSHYQRKLSEKNMLPEMPDRFWESFIGVSPDPVLEPPLLYCHSFRKVIEGNPEMGMMVEGESYERKSRFSRSSRNGMSSFKLEILKSMMGGASLFENIDSKGTENSLEKLNFLLKEFAGGEIAKLRHFEYNTVDIRIKNLEGNNSFSFDGLSSGQKEIISTLYLVWKRTREISSVVLIDEPELHLNYEWHSRFLRQLHEMAPDNQHIIATHSEKVFESAPAEKRALLEPGNQPEPRKTGKKAARA